MIMIVLFRNPNIPFNIHHKNDRKKIIESVPLIKTATMQTMATIPLQCSRRINSILFRRRTHDYFLFQKGRNFFFTISWTVQCSQIVAKIHSTVTTITFDRKLNPRAKLNSNQIGFLKKNWFLSPPAVVEICAAMRWIETFLADRNIQVEIKTEKLNVRPMWMRWLEWIDFNELCASLFEAKRWLCVNAYREVTKRKDTILNRIYEKKKNSK